MFWSPLSGSHSSQVLNTLMLLTNFSEKISWENFSIRVLPCFGKIIGENLFRRTYAKKNFYTNELHLFHVVMDLT